MSVKRKVTVPAGRSCMALNSPPSPHAGKTSRTVVSGPTLESPLTTVDSRLYVAASPPLRLCRPAKTTTAKRSIRPNAPRAAPIAATPQLMPGESVDGTCVDASCVGVWPICALCLSSALWRASVIGTEDAASVRVFDARNETGTGVGLNEAASVRTFEPGRIGCREAASVRTFDAKDAAGTVVGLNEAASVRTFEPGRI